MIKVEPIRDLKAIKRIKKLREDNPRDLCLFTFGINTAYRANELRSLTIGQVDYLVPGDRLELRQSKTGRKRATTVNRMVVETLDRWLSQHPERHNPRSPLFLSERGGDALSVPTISNKVKLWCAEVGLRGNYGSHTMRKTWGFHQLRINKAAIPVLMEAYGHSTQRQTLEYLCIEDDDVRVLYELEL